MWGVYKMSVSTGSAKTLVADPLATTSSPLLGLSSTPSFSPDSTEIVFASNAKFGNNPNNDWDLQKAKADGSAPSTPEKLTEDANCLVGRCRLTGEKAHDQYPRWGNSPPPLDVPVPASCTGNAPERRAICRCGRMNTGSREHPLLGSPVNRGSYPNWRGRRIVG